MRKENMMSSLKIPALAIGLALVAATPSLAQNYSTTGGMQNTQSMQSMQGMQGAQGNHQMSGTVTSVDKATGMINVTSEGKSLWLHFPSSTLTNIRSGDRVTVQLGLTKT